MRSKHLAPVPSRRTGMAILMLALVSLVVGQGDLYGPEAPQDVAWVRMINAAAGTVTGEVDGQQFDIVFGEASAYQTVLPGTTLVTVDGHAVELTAEPESFHTVALTSAGPLVVVDPALRDVSRGLLGLMNLTSLPALTLLTPDGRPVVQDVAPGQAEAVAVSAARTGLQVAAGEEAIASVAEQAFERGVAYTVVVMEADEGLLAVVVTAAAD